MRGGNDKKGAEYVEVHTLIEFLDKLAIWEQRRGYPSDVHLKIVLLLNSTYAPLPYFSFACIALNYTTNGV